MNTNAVDLANTLCAQVRERRAAEPALVAATEQLAARAGLAARPRTRAILILNPLAFEALSLLLIALIKVGIGGELRAWVCDALSAQVVEVLV